GNTEERSKGCSTAQRMRESQKCGRATNLTKLTRIFTSPFQTGAKVPRSQGRQEWRTDLFLALLASWQLGTRIPVFHSCRFVSIREIRGSPALGSSWLLGAS